ncbi:MAG: alpha/beta hydrolase [Hyphomicrobiales bacterium]|nr:alpha/beta hydrolase [Hyphomicrobiales bacterium]
MANAHRTARTNSGDVSLFYRVFGQPGATPILILHGSNYYDSVDWIEVGSALATDREVVTPDRRGWGESTWSPSKDYSLDALIDDMLAVMQAMKWSKAIVMGHSGAGPTIIAFAVNFPQMTEKLILVDSQMNREETARSGRSIGNPPTIFPTLEAAMAKFNFSNPPRLAWDRKRAEQAFVKIDQGLMLKRDPDGGNRQPIDEGAGLPRRPVREMWEELAMVKVPTMIVRGNRSSRYPAATVERLRRSYPHIPQVTVEAEHDVAGRAADALVAAVRRFIAAS